MFGLEAIFRNGVPVGHLRRADYAFFIDKTIGYGYIRNPDGGVVRVMTGRGGFLHSQQKKGLETATGTHYCL